MKKIIFTVGLVIMLMNLGITKVEAETTTVNSSVVAGDTTFTVDDFLDFGEQPLSNKIVFPRKIVGCTVIDYSGNNLGFTATAAISQTSEFEKLVITSVYEDGRQESHQLSTTPVEVFNKSELGFGITKGGFYADLELMGIEKTGNFSDGITWVFQKNTADIRE